MKWRQMVTGTRRDDHWVIIIRGSIVVLVIVVALEMVLVVVMFGVIRVGMVMAFVFFKVLPRPAFKVQRPAVAVFQRVVTAPVAKPHGVTDFGGFFASHLSVPLVGQRQPLEPRQRYRLQRVEDFVSRALPQRGAQVWL